MLLRQPPERDKSGLKFPFKHNNHGTFSKTMKNHIHLRPSYLWSHLFLREEKSDFIQNALCSFPFHSRGETGFSERELGIQS